MTGGRVVVLGQTGRNFAAGMSGGIAYVIDPDGDFAQRCNREMVVIESLEAEDEAFVHAIVERHVTLTGSAIGARVLEHWSSNLARFVRVMPTDYKLAIERQRAEQLGVAV
jgi:glutamate synthase domain-containing protein 3